MARIIAFFTRETPGCASISGVIPCGLILKKRPVHQVSEHLQKELMLHGLGPSDFESNRKIWNNDSMTPCSVFAVLPPRASHHLLSPVPPQPGLLDTPPCRGLQLLPQPAGGAGGAVPGGSAGGVGVHGRAQLHAGHASGEGPAGCEAQPPGLWDGPEAGGERSPDPA